MENIFDDIRPYNNKEFLEAMQRIAVHPNLLYISAFVYPGRPVDEMREKILSLRNVDEFQETVMYDGIGKVIELTTDGLSWSGFEKLDKNRKYLFISNHRDIMLDPALLQWCLMAEGMKTSEISFGDNLLMNQLFTDIGLSNKMFKVIRSGSMREMLLNSRHLSEYIRDAITVRKTSVWLAQRNGRTKDGVDSTDQGIMKMLSLSSPKGRSSIESFADFNIVPMAISYEKEPCDIMKAREILIRNTEGAYVKSEGEDAGSIMTGMSQSKGKVHIALGDPITLEDMEPMADLHVNLLNHSLSELMDKRIRSSYKLMCNNFIAHDITSGETRYSDRYTPQQKNAFENHVEKMVSVQKDMDQEQLRSILLGIYSNPVDSYFSSI